MKDTYTTLVLGIGNPNMGDDGIGIKVTDEIKRQGLEIATDCLYYISFEILDKIIGYNRVIIVDAADFGMKYSDISLVTYRNISQNLYLANSHGLSLYHVLKLGYEVFNDQMPDQLYLLLVQTGKIERFKREIDKKITKQSTRYS